MAEKTVLADCPERVALDLAKQIFSHESMDKSAPRRYWLELYRQCLLVVSHSNVPGDIKERPFKSEMS